MTEQEQVQLLPCPFCGYANPSMFYEWQVVCRPALDEDYPPEFGCDAEGPFGKTEAEAIAAWNTRHTATAEALEAMREAREALVNIRSMVVIHSSGYALDVYKCADAAIAKIEGQQP
jgi:hypothetical protein